jgi:hypothetical protein
MLVMKERQPPFRTAERWARLVLLEVGAIRECEEHGWMRDRSDPHARERALFIARHEPPLGISSERAVATVRDVLDTTPVPSARPSNRGSLAATPTCAALMQAS